MITEFRTDPLCVVCKGIFECRGGGEMRCRKRDPRASRIAGIIDCYGSIRFVVTHKKDFKHHVRADELLIMVPGLVVHEPIAWGDIPNVIGRIETHVKSWIASRPNLDEVGHRAVEMYKLRCLEQDQESLDLNAIVET